MNKFICLIILLMMSTPSSAKNFELVSKTPNLKSLIFTAPNFDAIEKDGFIRLTTPEKGSTTENGMPELPVYIILSNGCRDFL